MDVRVRTRPPGSVSWSFSRRAGDRRARQQRKGQRPGGLETHPGRRARSFETWEGDRSRGFSQTGTEEGEPQRGSPAPCDCAGAGLVAGEWGSRSGNLVPTAFSHISHGVHALVLLVCDGGRVVFCS